MEVQLVGRPMSPIQAGKFVSPILYKYMSCSTLNYYWPNGFSQDIATTAEYSTFKAKLLPTFSGTYRFYLYFDNLAKM